MKKEYWLERWRQEEIGFHQNEINPYLSRYWSELQVVSGKSGKQVFVPLCGKSCDMIWLREQNLSVLGVELSPLAVEAFFKENEYSPRHTTGEKFDQWDAGGIRLLCGDFFDLKKDHLAQVDAVYDRASLVALPPETRGAYTDHLLCILPPAIRILLITFDYPQSEMSGPPFAVSTAEVEALYGKRTDIRLLAKFNVLAENPRFQQRGISRLQESIFLLTTRTA
ncbi:thiopurine S-methyltransferase [Nitrosospira multiformis]|uniref:Thiopurine S-methyltransferase n=1 Tax=Nitrosospira multiformis TaxID=1231 RepID=A0A1H8EIT8_9PROT|nr:thiopurine S-methyltransferase [Nitrosospira multiformis]SEN19405.1 thiopurine S-methyltransferase [Nitrosospira multiformis]